MTRDEVIVTARSWRGIPFVHQGRTRAGVDCIGLVINVCKEVGFLLPDFDVNGYERIPDGSLFAECDKRLVRIPAPVYGCIAVMKFDTEPQHIGFIGEHKGHLTIIHALYPRDVAEHRLTTPWPSRIVGCFDIPQWHA